MKYKKKQVTDRTLILKGKLLMADCSNFKSSSENGNKIIEGLNLTEQENLFEKLYNKFKLFTK